MHIFSVDSLVKLDGAFCRYCLKEFKTPDRVSELTLDHIIPKSLVKELTARFGAMVTPDMPDNVVLACESCNNTKANTFQPFYPPHRMYKSGALYWWLSHGYLKQNFVELWENLSTTYRADTLWDYGHISKRAKQLFVPFTNLNALLLDYNPNGWKLSPLFQAYDFEFPEKFNPLDFYVQNNVQPKGTAFQAVRGTSYAGQAGVGKEDVYGKVELSIRLQDLSRAKVYPNIYGTYHTIASLNATGSWIPAIKSKVDKHKKDLNAANKQVNKAGANAKQSNDKFTSTNARIKAMQKELQSLSDQLAALDEQRQADKDNLDKLKDNQNFLKNQTLDLHDIRWSVQDYRGSFATLIPNFTGVVAEVDEVCGVAEESEAVAKEVVEAPCAGSEEVCAEPVTGTAITADPDGFIRNLNPLEHFTTVSNSQWVPAEVDVVVATEGLDVVATEGVTEGVEGVVEDTVEGVETPANDAKPAVASVAEDTKPVVKDTKPASPTTQGTAPKPKRKRKHKVGLGTGTKKYSIKLRKSKGSRGTYLSQYERQLASTEDALLNWEDDLYEEDDTCEYADLTGIDSTLTLSPEDCTLLTEEPKPLTNSLGDLLKGVKLL